MTPKALVVDDDPEILDAVSDVLMSLEHECDRADSVEAARTLLDRNQYDYILLDLEIPVRAGRNFARIQNGLNLLQQIVKQRGAERRPGVIVITAHGNDGPELGVEVMKLGAGDHVSKPFKSLGKTLDRSILELLAKMDGQSAGPAPAATIKERGAARSPLKTFERGTVVFFDDRVELLDIDITSGRSSKDDCVVLRAFAERLSDGAFKPLTGRALATLLEREIGEIPGYVRNLKGRIRKRLFGGGLQSGPHDVIVHETIGYHFTDRVSVQVTGASPQGQTAITDQENVPVSVTDVVPASVPDASADDVPARRDPKGKKNKAARVHWLREKFATGTKLRAPALAAEWGCSDRTIKRDIEKEFAEEVEFIGSPNSGHYCLKHKKPR